MTANSFEIEMKEDVELDEISKRPEEINNAREKAKTL